MSKLRLILSSLLYHWRMNVAVGLGVAVGTAVLTGALIVGDSVRGSLKQLTLDRLGAVDDALVSNHFFNAALATELAAEPDFGEVFDAVWPAILLEGSLAQPDSGTRASRVNLIGFSEAFWRAAARPPAAADELGPAEGEVFVNQPLAEELNLSAGQEVVARLPRPTSISPDSPLGKKTDLIANRRLRVAKIIPADGLGLFGLRPNQQASLNAYFHVADLQAALEQPERVNALLVAGRDPAAPPPAESEERLNDLLHPKLADYGLTLHKTERGYYNLTSQRMVLEPAVERAALGAWKNDHPQIAFTYLANYILAGKDEDGGDDGGGGKIPYSTITAVDLTDTPPLGPFKTIDGQNVDDLADDEILLNSWAADDLKQQGAPVSPGDRIRLTYFEPESTHGEEVETTRAFTLKAVVALDGPAADPDFTPELKGVTDQESLSNWDPPFTYDSSRVRDTPPHDEDERYWDRYRATPKGFVSLRTGRRLWASRFGESTSIRVAVPDGVSEAEMAERLEAELAKHKRALGFVFQPVKRQGLEASQGTTDFNELFLGFSFFIIASAVMLVALLFRLGIERRAREIGTLAAVGFKPRQVLGLLSAEGLLVALVGGVLGVAGGLGYARLMLAALSDPHWWLAAVSSPFLRLHYSVQSLAVGCASGVIISWLAIVWAVWRMGRVSVRQLLANRAMEESQLARRRPIVGLVAGGVSLVLAGVVALFANRLTGEAQAGAFFGSGALVLVALLMLTWSRLRSGGGTLVRPGAAGVSGLALRNGARHPGRATLTIGLVAAASFLIVAVSAFRLAPPDAAERRDSGSGGFALLAESDQPIFDDLNTADGRDKLGLSADAERLLADRQIVSLRVKTGDDASCLNLYQPRQPRVLGVPPALIERGGFEWAASAAETPEEQTNPWLLLDKQLPAAPDGAPRVPVVLDASTANYSLHLGGKYGTSPIIGAGYQVADGRGGMLSLVVVGLLKNSIFQGSLVISERSFITNYPAISGYRFFLVDTAPGDTMRVETALEKSLGDFGFDVETSNRRLTQFMAVQNTYLSTFQGLGGLGLLLGTFGLAIVQLRNVLERRGELALLRAIGFRRALLGRMVMIENVALLVAGLAVGMAAALVAIWPHLAAGGASLPWRWLGLTLGLVLGVGIVAGLAAVRAALVAPLLPALKSD